MKSIPQYAFHKTKYGDELLIDVVELGYARRFIPECLIHSLTYYDITYISGGAGFFCIDDQEHQVREGDLIFTRPGEIRKWDMQHIINGYALIFEEEFLLSFFNDPDFIRRLSYFRVDRDCSLLRLDEVTSLRILKLIKDIQNEIISYLTKDKHILRALLYEILMVLNREYKTSQESLQTVNNKVNPYITKFISLVNDEFKQSHSIQYYADKLCITPNYLNELIKQSVGINAKLLIQTKVLLEAKKMLTYTDVPVAQIAVELGFDNSSYFIRLFRKQTGVTPLLYRRHIRP